MKLVIIFVTDRLRRADLTHCSQYNGVNDRSYHSDCNRIVVGFDSILIWKAKLDLCAINCRTRSRPIVNALSPHTCVTSIRWNYWQTTCVILLDDHTHMHGFRIFCLRKHTATSCSICLSSIQWLWSFSHFLPLNNFSHCSLLYIMAPSCRPTYYIINIWRWPWHTYP